jgi:putative sterol carrier protein
VKYEFLSPEWIEAARAIRDEYQGRIGPTPLAVTVNLVLGDAPGGGTIEAHLDTSSGQPSLDLGLAPKPDVTLTMEYATARAAFAEQDGNAVMQAFMSGKIRVEGDMAKLMMMQAQQAQAGPLAAEVMARVKDITAA